MGANEDGSTTGGRDPSNWRHQEILFWLLLLGSWQFLSAGGNRNGVVGLAGTVAFLGFAARNLGKLTEMGFSLAAWRVVPSGTWPLAVVFGMAMGSMIYCVGVAAGSNMRLATDWKLIVLQISLGPVVEEIFFRGYLCALLGFAFRGFRSSAVANAVVIVIAAGVFSIAHVAQPGGSWLQFWCIGATGILYGIVRVRCKSTAASAMVHATYNLTLYAINWSLALFTIWQQTR
ncbi:MAG: CPBP family intramembrane metalloprotease [Bryobacteraceae bacterium]|nr:CPBP family intramembrane metalloprotease [Bryobacteraceae bacterium]